MDLVGVLKIDRGVARGRESVMDRVFRHSSSDALLVGAAVAFGGILVLGGLVAPAPVAGLLVAIGVWWCSNTIAHNHLHNPLFRSRTANGAFALWLTLMTGIPQTIWRARHLWHHAGEPVARRRPRLGARGVVEVALVATLFAALAAAAPRLFATALLPGWLAGLGLCQLQGRFEHAGGRDAGISFYGRLWNLLWFNDGYHVEHHRDPRRHWTRLPAAREAAAESAWPPILRPLDGRWNRLQARALVWLERIALASGALQRWLVDRHARAFAALLPSLAGRPLARVAVVGGGLFPRTVLVLRRVLPAARITVIDASADNIARARRYLAGHAPGGDVTFEQRRYAPGDPAPFDLIVLPLGFLGDRGALYRAATPALLVHDWAFHRRGRAGALISLLLCKRLNLVVN
jgi:Fatty acid desaturase